MRYGIIASLVFHVLMLSLLLWSDRIALEIFKKRREQLSLESLQVSVLYKATDTDMKKGVETKDLPPPIVPQKTPEEVIKKPKEMELKKSKKKEKPKKPEKDPKKQVEKPDLRKILSSIQKQVKDDDRPPPKEDNFPTIPTGTKGSLGTGGVGLRKASPAEQALQSAMRRYFELPEGTRKRLGQARGFIDIKIVGLENQFKIVSLRVVESSGHRVLDQSCETAIRKSLDAEVFAKDVIDELNGKEHTILCYP